MKKIGDMLINVERDKYLRKIAEKENILSENKEILDFGCGEGFVMDLFNKWGASPHFLTGVDISDKRISNAKLIFPKFNFFLIDNSLPFEDEKFSAIIVSTVFSSIRNNQERAFWASELTRVLKSNGVIIFYDMKINNPFNAKTKKVLLSDLKDLFNGYEINHWTLTVWPHFARLISKFSIKSYSVMTKFKFLHTHFIASLVKK